MLDGVGVTQPEVGAARQRYAGRVDRDFLEDRLGSPRDWDSVTVLDLSGQKLRQIDQLSSSEFKHLRELNLNENILTALGGLSNLPELRTLRLNRNKIQSLESSTAAASRGGRKRGGGGEDAVAKALAAAHEAAAAAQESEFGLAEGIGLSAMGLGNLEELQLGYNRVTDVRQLNLGGMPCLRVLVLQGNDISELDGLEHLPCLQELVLDKNRIRCLDCLPLRNCVALRSLHVEDNGLRRLKNMDAIAFSLETLHLGTNRLNDLQVRSAARCVARLAATNHLRAPSRGGGHPFTRERVSFLSPHPLTRAVRRSLPLPSPTCSQELDHLAVLSRLHVLTLHKNPVARRQQYRFAIIHALPGIHVLDGKEISAEERERVDLAYMQAPQVYVNEVRRVCVWSSSMRRACAAACLFAHVVLTRCSSSPPAYTRAPPRRLNSTCSARSAEWRRKEGSLRCPRSSRRTSTASLRRKMVRKRRSPARRGTTMLGSSARPRICRCSATREEVVCQWGAAAAATVVAPAACNLRGAVQSAAQISSARLGTAAAARRAPRFQSRRAPAWPGRRSTWAL